MRSALYPPISVAGKAQSRRRAVIERERKTVGKKERRTTWTPTEALVNV